MITISQIIQTIRTIVSEQPKRIYTTDICKYNCNPDAVGERCLFGEAFHRLGLTIPPEHNETGVHVLWTVLGLQINHAQVLWCDCLQEEQDSGKEWGVALKKADEELENEQERN